MLCIVYGAVGFGWVACLICMFGVLGRLFGLASWMRDGWALDSDFWLVSVVLFAAVVDWLFRFDCSFGD